MTSTGDTNGEVPLSNSKLNGSAEGSALVRGGGRQMSQQGSDHRTMLSSI